MAHSCTWQGRSVVALHNLGAKPVTVSLDLPADRRQAVRYDRFIAAPGETVAGLCKSLDFAWDQPLDRALPLARHTLTPPSSEKWRRHEAVIESLLPRLQPTIEQAERFIGS